jgi:hypothetical protein
MLRGNKPVLPTVISGEESNCWQPVLRDFIDVKCCMLYLYLQFARIGNLEYKIKKQENGERFNKAYDYDMVVKRWTDGRTPPLGLHGLFLGRTLLFFGIIISIFGGYHLETIF